MLCRGGRVILRVPPLSIVGERSRLLLSMYHRYRTYRYFALRHKGKIYMRERKLFC